MPRGAFLELDSSPDKGTTITGTGAQNVSGYVKVITTLRQKRERELASQALQEFGDVLYSHANLKVTRLLPA